VLRELSLAWQKLSLYQDGHPLREQGVEQAHAALTRHLARHGPLPLGISRTALIGPEEKLDGEAAGKLAAALHRRSVALLRFDLGVTRGELLRFLEHLPSRTAADETPWAVALPHIQVELIDFSELVEAATAGTSQRRTSLWDRVLERILQREGGDGGYSGESGRERTLDEVVTAIRALLDRYRQGDDSGQPAAVPAYVLAFVGGALREAVEAQLAEAPRGETSTPLFNEIGQLLAAVPAELQGPVIDSVLRELCAGAGDAEALQIVAERADPRLLLLTLGSLRREGLTLRPAELLAIEPRLEQGCRQSQGLNSNGLNSNGPNSAAHLAELLGDGDIDRVQAPEGEDRRILLRLAPVPARTDDGLAAEGAPSESVAASLDSLSPQRFSIALANSLLELFQRSLLDDEQAEAVAWRLQEIFLALLSAGSVSSAARILRSLRQLADAAEVTSRRRTAQRLLERLGQSRTVPALVDAMAGTAAAQAAVPELVDLLGPAILRELLMAMGEEKDRSRRRRLFDLLATLGPRLTPHLSELLADPRWFVVRNIFTLLQRTGTGLSPQLVDWGLRHAEPRVRLEAVKCLALVGHAVPAAVIERALADPDPKVAEIAVAAVGSGKLASGMAPLLALLAQRDRLGRQRELRVKALHSLGQLANPAALAQLRPFFRGRFSGIHADERRAAFASLAYYPAAARQPYVDAGLRSSDAEVRALCTRLRGAAAAAPAPPAAPQGREGAE
jgi:hypothetical protein